MLESLRLSLYITLRNWTVYKKDLLANTSPTLAEPLMFMLTLGLGLGAFIEQLDGRSYGAFLAPGLVASSALMTSFFESSYGFYVRMTFENVYKAMLTTPINVREVVMGEYIWVALKGAAMAFGVALVLVPFGYVQDVTLLPLILLVGGLTALACGAIGLLASSLVRNINQFQSIYSFFIAPLFFFSGIFFPLNEMPLGLQIVAQLFPVAHGVKLAQSVFWNEGVLNAFMFHGGILVAQGVLLAYLGYWRIRRKLLS